MMLMLSSTTSTPPKAALAPLLPLLPVAVALPVAPPLVVGTRVGVKTALGLEMHEVAAALAAEELEDAKELTVPLPPKLHAWAFLPLAS